MCCDDQGLTIPLSQIHKLHLSTTPAIAGCSLSTLSPMLIIEYTPGIVTFSVPEAEYCRHQIYLAISSQIMFSFRDQPEIHLIVAYTVTIILFTSLFIGNSYVMSMCSVFQTPQIIIFLNIFQPPAYFHPSSNYSVLKSTFW